MNWGLPTGSADQLGPLLIYLLSLAGGAGRNAVFYANSLAREGHAVTLVCGALKGEELAQNLDSRIDLKLLGVRRNLLAIPKLIHAIRRVAPSRALVIGPSNLFPFTLAAAAAGFRGEVALRVADSPEGMQAVYAPPVRLAKRLSLSCALPRAGKVIALTHAMAGELEQFWGVPFERIHLIPNGVALPEGIPKRTLGDTPVLLCVGRLVPQKDHATLLRAFAFVRRARACRLLLAGKGSERGRLEDLARSLGIADDVSFLGHVTDLGPLYRSAQLTVLSSRHEGFPNVLIEALAHGCPIVATDCPTGPAEVINSPEFGLLAQVGEPENLAARILEALECNFDPAQLRARAEDFSMELLHERIKALFSA